MQQLSIWEKESFFGQQDVIIIGSGFSGLWSALHLKLLYPHCKITILERGFIPFGASSRNAGFCCFGSPSEIIADAESMGEDEMWKLVSNRYEGLREIHTFFKDEEIDYEQCGGFECFEGESGDWLICKEKLEWLNAGLKTITGEEKVFTIADSKISEFGFSGFSHMIENKLEGSLHPGKLIKALLKKVQALDVQVITGMDVVKYDQKDNQVIIETRQGMDWVCNKLLICTNAFSKQFAPLEDINPSRGQVLITHPMKNLLCKGTFHFNKGFYYFRNVGKQVLIGGARNIAFEEENTMECTTTEKIQQELERFLHRHILPGEYIDIADRWAGIMAMGKSKSPIVKQLGENVFCCVRLSGMGVALAPTISRQAITILTASL